MAVRIRLKRIGSKNRPVYRIVAADSRSPRDGKCIEELGAYRPMESGNENFSIDLEKVDRWIANGAKPTDTVKSFINKARRAAAAAEPAA